MNRKIHQAPKVETGKENVILGQANHFVTMFKQNIEKLSIIEVTTVAIVKSFLKEE